MISDKEGQGQNMGRPELIIGITGTNGSGKDTVAGILINEKGFEKNLSLSGPIREEVARRGLDKGVTDLRPILRKVGDEMRKRFGPGYWAAVLARNLTGRRIIISGIRNPAEIDEIQKSGVPFFLVSVDGLVEERYKRAQVGRGRSYGEENISLEAFKRIDDAQIYGGETEQERAHRDPFVMYTAGCMDRADFKIYNDGTLEDLRAKVDEMLKVARSKFPI
ncbi:MAG: hypothetical protein WC797_03685 [Candidatus Paceibacterota bacterium]|jgi:dephospho-CoA kinase